MSLWARKCLGLNNPNGFIPTTPSFCQRHCFAREFAHRYLDRGSHSSTMVRIGSPLNQKKHKNLFHENTLNATIAKRKSNQKLCQNLSDLFEFTMIIHLPYESVARTRERVNSVIFSIFLGQSLQPGHRLCP